MKTLKNIFAVTFLVTCTTHCIDTNINAMKRDAVANTTPTNSSSSSSSSSRSATPQNNSRLLQMPPEVLCNILSSVPVPDVLSFAKTSHEANNFVANASPTDFNRSFYDCLGNSNLVNQLIQHYLHRKSPLTQAQIKNMLIDALATRRTHPLNDAGKSSLLFNTIPLVTTNLTEQKLEFSRWNALFEYTHLQPGNDIASAWINNHYKLGKMYFEGEHVTKDYQQARIHFEIIASIKNALISSLRTTLKAHYYLGSLCFHGGHGITQDYQQALTHFNFILDPNNHAQHVLTDNRLLKVHSFVGHIYYFGGHGIDKNYQEALTYFNFILDPNNQAQKLVPDIWVDAHCLLGYIYVDNEDYQEAKNHFDIILDHSNEAHTHNTTAWLNAHCYLGVMLYEGDGIDKDYQEAKNHFNIILDPNNHAASDNIVTWLDAHRFLGRIYFYNEDYQEAKDHFDSILDIIQTRNPNAWFEAHFYLSLIYFRGSLRQDGEYDIAPNYRQVLTHLNFLVDPNNKAPNDLRLKAYYYLGQIYFYGEYGIAKNYRLALTYFNIILAPNNHAQELFPRDWLWTHYFLGIIYYFGGYRIDRNCRLALTHFNIILDPNNHAQELVPDELKVAQLYKRKAVAQLYQGKSAPTISSSSSSSSSSTH